VSKYVEFPLEGGGSILIEAADEPTHASAGFLRDDARGGADKAQQSFDASIEAVKRSAGVLVNKLRELTPDELQVNFNLKASGEMGGLTVGKAGAGGEANFNVTLKWQKQPDKEKEKEEEKDKGKEKA